ncbi:hypothetical protein [Serratia ficaria]|uniref:hypothetical protein n=1 Tax=Serratia ficaria TaxID=61651 RepID=UPI002179220C|nr:hypothetical protein [Serratia ficaria]CAI1143205.1 Uncharacterised protein [Serratia ficaria]CAI1950963.1 Uncharacterised protein [Serratia ficaria]CAI2787791.1 Uncharacterised protein [Serratia ficaria]
MGSITIAGRQIFVLTENDQYPEPLQNSPAMFAIREDEEGQHWLYIYHDQRWPLVSETPFENHGKAIDAVLAFDFTAPYK